MPIRRVFASFLAAALLSSGPTLLAQTAPSPAAPLPQAPPPDLYTLHVYANLAQVPTLILSPDGRPFRQLTPDLFFISLDGGPQFHPAQLRIEGDDSVSLAIIVDQSGSQTHFNTNIADSLAQLIPKDLHPRDHVSIYAIDCKAVQSVNDVPVSSAEVIRNGVTSALSAPDLHGGKLKPACKTSVHLWDLVAHVAEKLGQTPSRRVILLFSLGMDAGSTTTFDEVVHIAQTNSVAVFGMRDIEEFNFQRNFRDSTPQDTKGTLNSHGHYSDSLGKLATLSGGMVYDRLHIQIEDALHLFVSMLRGRYIVEFPRPDAAMPGTHQIAITIPSRWDYTVRFTGASMPLPDPSVLNDPNTVHGAPSPATFGNHPPPQPKH